MTRIWIVLAVLAVVGIGSVAPVLPQEANTSEGTREVIFSFGGWGLGSYNGGVGLRYFVADDVGVRWGLDVGIDDHSGDYEYRWPTEIDVETEGYDAGTFESSFFAEKYVSGLRDLKPFLALGLAYRYDEAEYDYTGVDYSDSATEYYYASSYARTEHTVSLIGGFGFQWYFTDRIGLGGQYNVIVGHSWIYSSDRHAHYSDGEIGVDAANNYDTSVQETNIDIGAGNLLLSVRF
jgi:hypothetical protein